MGDPSVLLRFPHIFKVLQSVNAIILIICIGSATAVPGNGIVWFIIVTSLILSVFAAILFAFEIHDYFIRVTISSFMPWDLFELIYSFIYTILSAVSVWLCFSYIKLVPADGRFGGYIAAGLFMLIHMVLYAIPTFLLSDKLRDIQQENFDPLMEARSHDPLQETSYQSQA